jgi:hypothetical protein
MGGIYELTVEMTIGGMIYIPNCIKIGSGIQILIAGYTDTWRAHRPTFIFKMRKIRSKYIASCPHGIFLIINNYYFQGLLSSWTSSIFWNSKEHNVS